MAAKKLPNRVTPVHDRQHFPLYISVDRRFPISWQPNWIELSCDTFIILIFELLRSTHHKSVETLMPLFFRPAAIPTFASKGGRIGNEAREESV